MAFLFAMKRPRISKVKRNALKTYIIDPEYIKAKSHLISVLKSQDEWIRLMDYCVAAGRIEFPLVRVVDKIIVNDALRDISKFERWPNVLNGSPFLKENGYADDLLDDLY